MTKPQLGFWYARCCIEDLYQITSLDELREVETGIESGQIPAANVWETEDQAREALE